jgi:hypothetical protein
VTTALFVVLAIVPVLAALTVVIVRMRGVAVRGRAAVAGTARQAAARSLGFGSGEGRGNCSIGVDDRRFVVSVWSPPRVVEIPLRRVVAVEAARTRGGRTARDVLRVRFTGDSGTPDAVEFVVADVPGWVAELRRRSR